MRVPVKASRFSTYILAYYDVDSRYRGKNRAGIVHLCYLVHLVQIMIIGCR